MRLWAHCFALLVLTCGAVSAQDEAVQLDVQEKILSNGLKVLVVERDTSPRIACRLVHKVGAVNDPAGLTGVAHLFEHMMFKGTHVIGTTDYEAEIELMARIDEIMGEIRQARREGDEVRVEELRQQYEETLAAQRAFIVANETTNIYESNGGTSLNAGTGQDMTIFMVDIPANKLELFVWLESDRMVNPVLREFYKEREVVLDERRMRVEANPYGHFIEEMNSVFYTAHPYGRPVGGWADDIMRIRREQAIGFFQDFYAPNNATLVLVGDVRADEAFEMAERYFGRVEPSDVYAAELITSEPQQHGERRLVAETMAQGLVMLRYHAVARMHEDYYALSTLGDVLSGRSGRLHKALVLDADIAFDASASVDGSHYAGSFVLHGMPKAPDGHQAVEDALLAEVQRIIDEPPTEEELGRVRNAADAGFIRGLRSNGGLAMQLAVMDMLGDWREVIEAPAKIRAVTAEDVARVAQKYLTRDNLTVGWVKTKAPAGVPQVPAGGGEGR